MHGIYFDFADRLRLTTFGALASVILSVEGRMRENDGRIVPFRFTHVPTSDRTAASDVHNPGEGELIDVSIRASTGAPRIGQVFALLEIIRGHATQLVPLGAILQGYVTDTTRLYYPGSARRSSIDGPGVIRSITGTDPAANTEISETVPTNARWRLLTFHVPLVTDANVANRASVLLIDDGTNVVARAIQPGNFTAGVTYNLTWARQMAMSSQISANAPTAGLPDMLLMGGYRLRTSTVNIQAGDNYGAPQLLVEEWIED